MEWEPTVPAPYGTQSQLQQTDAHLREMSVLHCLIPSDRAVMPSAVYSISPSSSTPQSMFPSKLQQGSDQQSGSATAPYGTCSATTLHAATSMLCNCQTTYLNEASALNSGSAFASSVIPSGPSPLPLRLQQESVKRVRRADGMGSHCAIARCHTLA